MPRPDLLARVRRLNDALAIRATLAFGSMWTTYLFVVYGFAPLLWPAAMDKLLYWSNTVQLWSLPLLMVGSNLLGRAAEKRAEEQYQMTRELVAGLHEELGLMRDDHADLAAIVGEVHALAKGQPQP